MKSLVIYSFVYSIHLNVQHNIFQSQNTEKFMLKHVKYKDMNHSYSIKQRILE